MTKDIKVGYKKTKIGWIPEDWSLSRLKDIAQIGSGTTPSKSVKEYWNNGNIPWLPTGKVNDRVITQSETFITKQAIIEKSISLLPIDSIVIAMIGQGKTRGKAAIIKIEAWVNQNFAYLRPSKNIHPEFLFILLENNYLRIRYEGNRGGTQGSLNTGMVKDLKFAFPSLNEQKKIAEILSTWDKAIEHTQNLIGQLKLRKKGLMQQLLTGKSRLSGFSRDWENVKLGDVTERITQKNTELNDNVVTISAQRGFVRQEDFFKKRVASATLSGYYLIKKGDFAYNKSYSKGYPMGAFKRLNRFDKAVVTTLYICFSIKNTVDSDFMVNFFEGSLMVNNLMRIAQEGGRAHGLLNISLGDFFSLRMRIPSIEEQGAIAKVLNVADSEINYHESYLQNLQQQKKGLMQQLLTGQKRVSTN